jgi:uncharacterized membrane protein
MDFVRAYKWLWPSLAFTVLLIIGRVVYTFQFTFLFLIWNLFLAILPLWFSHKLETALGRKAWAYAGLWLLFFPNAMYIVTDLFHLRQREEIPMWYDLLLLLSAALNGVIMGFHSLHTIERWLSGFIRRRYISVVVFQLLYLCGYGIYLGRYERWNSWDIISNPFSLLLSMMRHVIHPFRNMDIWTLSTAFAIWMYLLYRYLPKGGIVKDNT